MTVQFGDQRLPQRFWDKVSPEPNSGCWLWTGSIAPRGYGQFSLPRQRKLARCSRLIAEISVGKLRGDQHVCHRCDNPYCCNPEHLFVGTASDNMRDCHAKGRHPTNGYSPRTHCRRGHDKRTVAPLPRGECRQCRREIARAKYQRTKEQA